MKYLCCSVETVEPTNTDAPSAPKTRSHKNMTDEDFEQLPTENIDWEQLGTENRELLRDWSRRKEQELLDIATQYQHTSSICPVGRDRFFRTYWVFHSVPGLFVEVDTVDCSISELSRRLDGLPSNGIPTHSSPDSAPSQTRWSVYGSVDDVDRLLESLNARGFREGPLRAVLMEQRDRLKDWVGQCDLAALTTPCNVSMKTSASTTENENLVGVVRETVLDLEERVYSGSLGSLKVGLLTAACCSSSCCCSCSSSSSSDSGSSGGSSSMIACTLAVWDLSRFAS